LCIHPDKHKIDKESRHYIQIENVFVVVCCLKFLEAGFNTKICGILTAIGPTLFLSLNLAKDPFNSVRFLRFSFPFLSEPLLLVCSEFLRERHNTVPQFHGAADQTRTYRVLSLRMSQLKL